MTFEDFTTKLAIIQSEEHLTIDETLDIKRQIVGTIKLWDCTENQLEEIMQEYRKRFKRNKYSQKSVYYKRKYVKSKHKYGNRKDWD